MPFSTRHSLIESRWTRALAAMLVLMAPLALRAGEPGCGVACGPGCVSCGRGDGGRHGGGPAGGVACLQNKTFWGFYQGNWRKWPAAPHYGDPAEAKRNPAREMAPEVELPAPAEEAEAVPPTQPTTPPAESRSVRPPVPSADDADPAPAPPVDPSDAAPKPPASIQKLKPPAEPSKLEELFPPTEPKAAPPSKEPNLPELPGSGANGATLPSRRYVRTESLGERARAVANQGASEAVAAIAAGEDNPRSRRRAKI